MAASAPLARAFAAAPKPWLAYERQLTSRLDDAGGGQFDADFARSLLIQTNRFRASQGLSQLQWDSGLATAASAHAADMVARGYFAHESPEGFTHIDRVSLLNRDLCGQTAENLVWQSTSWQGVTPQQIEAMWEGSHGHRLNLLNPTFGQAGYGVVRVGDRIFAAGVYANVAVRLAHALPLNITAEAELAGAIAGASPHIERLSLTAPFEHPTWMASPTETLPPLKQGVWQLRPLRPADKANYFVLPGPLFYIS